VLGPEDLVLDLGLRDRRAEIVFGLDAGLDFFAQGDRLGGRLDLDLELGLLVLLDAERADPSTARQADPVDAEGGLVGDLELAIEAAVLVGRVGVLEDLLALGIIDLDGELLAGIRRLPFAVVLGLVGPDLEPDLLLGPIGLKPPRDSPALTVSWLPFLWQIGCRLS